MSPPSVTGPGICGLSHLGEVLGFGPDEPGTQVKHQQVLNTGHHFFLLIPPASRASVSAVTQQTLHQILLWAPPSASDAGDTVPQTAQAPVYTGLPGQSGRASWRKSYLTPLLV